MRANKTILAILLSVTTVSCAQGGFTAENKSLFTSVLKEKGLGRWRRNEEPTDTLLAFTAANQGHRTAALLTSLVGTRDSYDILVLDEHSTDTTASDLARFGVRTLYVNQSIGVTALWNLAYQHYLEHGYKNLIYSNNDVLVPNGVIDKLRAALDNGCDLVMPISTVRGLGHIGKVEGLESLLELDDTSAKLVNNPGNYLLVQHALNMVFFERPMEEAVAMSQPHFNGFFFALSPRVKEAAFSEQHLFDPSNIVLHQERDLAERMRAKKMQICFHRGAFVFHFKASTIPEYAGRATWRRNDDEAEPAL